MKYSVIPSAQSLVAHCKAKGIQNIVISPGSRNAPLIIGFSEDSYFSCYSIVDERCAAFFALGMAQQSKIPVVLICTSGSALLNYYPAVAEAFYSRVSLLILSADRPSYKIDIGDGQTIRQENVFQNHILGSHSLQQDVAHATETIRKYAPDMLVGEDLDKEQQQIQAYNDARLNEAMEIVFHKKGPVHINVPFEEPLYNTLSKPTVHPHILRTSPSREVLPENLGELKEIWGKSLRKMILVGVNPPEAIDEGLLDMICRDPTIVVFTETTSNLYHPNLFPSIDMIIAPLEKSAKSEEHFRELRPEVLITFGGLIVSKKIKAFLREFKPLHHWHIDPLRAFDTFFVLSQHVRQHPGTFLSELPYHTTKQPYGAHWSKIRQKLRTLREKYLEQVPFSDMKAFYHMSRRVPNNYQLHLANSSTVRYAQLFDWNPGIATYCNRGTSGIDGSTSTALGAALYYRYPTLLITGDLS
ncbi:MAG: thiamine pyrophosphate-binding protein, partial [Bacteroidota bacterium]